MVDTKLFYMTSLIILIGIIFSYSLSVYTVLLFETGHMAFFMKQFLFGMTAIFVMWILSRMDADFIVPLVGYSLFILFLILMVAMNFMPESFATSAGGAKRWIRLGVVSISPVEFFKIGFIYFIAWSFSRKIAPHKNLGLKEELKIFAPYIMVLFVPIAAIIFILQNDLGQTVLLGLLMLTLSLLAGFSFRVFFGFILTGIIGVVMLIVFTNKIARVELWWASVQNTILSFLPESIAVHLRVEQLPEPYQIGNSLNAIKNGGFFGTGLANGDFKYGYLSEVHTDFVLAGIAEELGVVMILFIASLMFLIVYRIFKIANRSNNSTYFLFSSGIGLLISFAFLINALGVAGVTPIKGMAVPFLSYGGSSVIALAIGIGLVLSISKKVKIGD